MDKLFVYGTLRPGSKNEYAQRLAKAARHLGGAKIHGRLYRVAHYPALVASQSQDDWVKGDVFGGVTTELLHVLDEYEGAEYSRDLAEATLENGQTIEVYFYRYLMPTHHLEWIRSGDWFRLRP